MIRESGFESIHEAMRILPRDDARSVEHIKKHEFVIADLQLFAASWLRRLARRHDMWHHDHWFCGHCLNRPLTKGRRNPDFVEVTKLAPPLVAKRGHLPHPYPYLVVRARKGSCMEMQEAMDSIGVDVDERDWVTGPLPALGAPHARLMDEQFVNWYNRYRNRGGPQCSQISAARRAEAADNSNWTIEIDAGKIGVGMGARGCYRHNCFNFG